MKKGLWNNDIIVRNTNKAINLCQVCAVKWYIIITYKLIFPQLYGHMKCKFPIAFVKYWLMFQNLLKLNLSSMINIQFIMLNGKLFLSWRDYFTVVCWINNFYRDNNGTDTVLNQPFIAWTSPWDDQFSFNNDMVWTFVLTRNNPETYKWIAVPLALDRYYGDFDRLDMGCPRFQKNSYSSLLLIITVQGSAAVFWVAVECSNVHTRSSH